MRLLRRNMATKGDSYKWTHPRLITPETDAFESYLEGRIGGEHSHLQFFGLQFYLREYFEGPVVDQQGVLEAEEMHRWHFAGPPEFLGRTPFNRAGWDRILTVHDGCLPLRICAVPEGTVVPIGNVLMTVEDTDPTLPWVDGFYETLLMKNWFPTTIATKGWHLKHGLLVPAVVATGGQPWMADYMLHDFGYRGVSSEESAGIGGMAHLVNFTGTDTTEGMRFARAYYGAGQGVGKSVVAAEHRIMTQLGPEGEHTIAKRIIAQNPGCIISIVCDSYDYYHEVDRLIDDYDFVKQHRVRLVLRPDSTTAQHPTKTGLVQWTLGRVASRLERQVTTTQTGHKVTPYGVLYGDGMEDPDIWDMFKQVTQDGYAAHNLVVGQGGGLHQKVNRDTERFAYKASAVKRNGVWHDVSKRPLDASKASKAGRLALVAAHDGFRTVRFDEPTWDKNMLEPVFENGVVLRQDTFNTVRTRGNSLPIGYAAPFQLATATA